MTIKAVAWDIDGTLVNSEPLHLRALHHVCAHYGADISDLSDEHFIGVNVFGVWQELRPRFPAGVEYGDWLSVANTYYHENVASVDPIAHAFETIKALHDAGIRQVAVSNSNRPIVDANLKRLGVEDYFEFSLSLDDVEKAKPDPQPYLLAAQKIGISPSEMACVEDSPSGAKSGRAAGLFVVGYKDSHDHIDDANVMIDRLSELPQIVANKNGEINGL